MSRSSSTGSVASRFRIAGSRQDTTLTVQNFDEAEHVELVAILRELRDGFPLLSTASSSWAR